MIGGRARPSVRPSSHALLHDIRAPRPGLSWVPLVSGPAPALASIDCIGMAAGVRPCLLSCRPFCQIETFDLRDSAGG
jgi:hypothetical protein